MIARVIAVALSGFCLISMTTVTFAEVTEYYSAPTSPNHGYSSVGSGPSYSPTFNPPTAPPRRVTKHVTIQVNTPNTPYYVTRNYPRGKQLYWVNMGPRSIRPRDIVVGGNQPNPPYTLYICRGVYRGAEHPGKLVGNRCNISWGGQEIRLSHYQVLVSKIGLGWVSSNNGHIPVNAIEGGFENGRPLYICQADYNGGMHPGKIIGSMCNIAWGGREISVPYYNILVR